jgi:hypothetical protein
MYARAAFSAAAWPPNSTTLPSTVILPGGPSSVVRELGADTEWLLSGRHAQKQSFVQATKNAADIRTLHCASRRSIIVDGNPSAMSGHTITIAIATIISST